MSASSSEETVSTADSLDCTDSQIMKTKDDGWKKDMLDHARSNESGEQNSKEIQISLIQMSKSKVRVPQFQSSSSTRLSISYVHTSYCIINTSTALMKMPLFMR